MIKGLGLELPVYAELYSNLQEERYATMRPFGRSLTYSLNHARFREDGYAVWEEEDYCSPPLAQEREAAQDEFFDALRGHAGGEGRGMG